MNHLRVHMKGMQLTGHGRLDKLVLRDDIPVPAPGPREVLIKVRAAGVNNTDINTRIGWYSKSDGDSSDASWSGEGLHFPRIQGADVCGEVVAVGAQAEPHLLHKQRASGVSAKEPAGSVLTFQHLLRRKINRAKLDLVRTSPLRYTAAPARIT